jgi:hypothetical protein
MPDVSEMDLMTEERLDMGFGVVCFYMSKIGS